MNLLPVRPNEEGPVAPDGQMRRNRPRTSAGYERVRLFLSEAMSMSLMYQPLMVSSISTEGGVATHRQIAAGSRYAGSSSF